MTDTGPGAGVTVYSSLRGLLASLFSPTVLLLVGSYGIMSVGSHALPVAITVLGAILAPVSLFDYPRHTVFAATGIVRVCYLRRETLPWREVVALERSHGSVSKWLRLRGPREPGDDGEKRPPATGGLVARVGKRRYLLADRAESVREFDEIRDVVAEHASHVMIRAPRPADTTPPSNLYRRTQNRT